MKRAAFPLLSALLVSACTVGPDFKAPQPPAISTYAAKGDAPAPDDQRVALGKQIEGDWWAGFQSPSLNDVVILALAGNEDAEAAKERMAEAEEEVNAAEGALLPQVSLGATAGYQKYGKALFGPLNFNIPPFAYYSRGTHRHLSARSFRRPEAHRGTAQGAAGISAFRTGRRLSVAGRPCRGRGPGAGQRPRRTRYR